MVISCFSFTEIAKRAAALMTDGGSMITLTYAGSTRVMPNYNVMGVAKAALEASVRYLAADYGPQDIRVNAISAGPVRTLAGAGVADAREMYNYQQRNSPMRRNVTIDDVGGSALYLLSDLSKRVRSEMGAADPLAEVRPALHQARHRRFQVFRPQLAGELDLAAQLHGDVARLLVGDEEGVLLRQAARAVIGHVGSSVIGMMSR